MFYKIQIAMKKGIMKKVFAILSLVWLFMSILGILLIFIAVQNLNDIQDGVNDLIYLPNAEFRFAFIFGFVLLFLGISFPPLLFAINRLLDRKVENAEEIKSKI